MLLSSLRAHNEVKPGPGEADFEEGIGVLKQAVTGKLSPKHRHEQGLSAMNHMTALRLRISGGMPIHRMHFV